MHICIIHQTKHGHGTSCSKMIAWQYSKKAKIASYISLKVRYTIWFMISEKGIRSYTFLRGARVAQKISVRHFKNCALEFVIISAVKLHSCELVVFMVKNKKHHQIGGRKFYWVSPHILTSYVAYHTK